MSNKKKILLGVAFTLDAALTIALFVISIIMLVTMPKTQTDFIIAQQTPGLIPYLQTHHIPSKVTGYLIFIKF